PARDRDLFRQEPSGAAPRQLWPQGRSHLRLHQPHHDDLGPGTLLPDAAVQAVELQLVTHKPAPDRPLAGRRASPYAACKTKQGVEIDQEIADPPPCAVRSRGPFGRDDSAAFEPGRLEADGN